MVSQTLRGLFRKLYFRSRLFRRVAPLFIDGRPPALDDSHLLSFREEDIGPLQRDEALALFALVRVLRPRTIVEFGFLNGHSALNFLLASDPECRVYSFDITEKSEAIARQCLGHEQRFRFTRKSQDEFAPVDIEGRAIDLCFLDASHDLALNHRTFERLLPQLSDRALVAVHDTGLWHRAHLKQTHLDFTVSPVGRGLGRWLDADRYQPVVEEREFVNELRQRHPEFAQIHLHSARTHRNGLTLLQKNGPLETGTPS
jgi:predicted O-methyltransferase YrrM